MPRYVIKALIDIEALDDLDARRKAAAWVQANLSSQAVQPAAPAPKDIVLRELMLQCPIEHKSIKMNPDGTFHAQWNKGGATRGMAGGG